MRLTFLEGRTNTRFPDLYGTAHQLCFFLHDSMTNLLITGRESKAFYTTFKFQDEAEKRQFLEASDIFAWLDETRRHEDRISLLMALVFPAVLGDMVNCIYETLETSRKGKLTISYMLLRKPLQESLFVLENIAADPDGFADSMNTDPTRLHSQGSGRIAIHQERITAVLAKIDPLGMFEAAYLTKLRYDKAATDGFDGICNNRSTCLQLVRRLEPVVSTLI
ncbi:MAG: hypothetical protein ACRYFY_14265 [Janthinobacterium lividum]